MDLLILPGNSPSNKRWTEEIIDRFKNKFGKIVVVEYDSWLTNDFGKILNFEDELKKIKIVSSKIKRYCVFAKSVGTALCMKAVVDGTIDPKKCVFVGIPLKWLSENGIPIENWAGNFHIPTTIIQQIDDPFGRSKDVREFIKMVDSVSQYLTIDGDDHKYGNVDNIIEKSLRFLSK